MSRNARKFRRKHGGGPKPEPAPLPIDYESLVFERGRTTPPGVLRPVQRQILEKMRERFQEYLRAHPETRYEIQSVKASAEHTQEWRSLLAQLGPLATVIEDSLVFEVSESDKPSRLDDLKAVMELVGPPAEAAQENGGIVEDVEGVR